MNENLINTLARQAGVCSNNSVDLERFAGLIIEECQRACENYINDCGEVNGVPDSVFNSHFGIE